MSPHKHVRCGLRQKDNKNKNRKACSSAAGGAVRVLFEDRLGVADFHLPNNSCVLYVSESDVIAGNGYKRKLVRYRNVG